MKNVNIGIDMGGTRIKMGLIDVAGNILETRSLKARSGLGMAQVLEDLVAPVNELLNGNEQVKGIGIAFPGIVDPVNKRVLSDYVKYPGAGKTDFEAWAGKNWGVPLALENDARAALIGEWQFGAGKGCDNLVMITLGTGVGTAVLIDGKLLRGKNFLAGNLGGHMSIDYKGRVCNCGNIGCVESTASTWVLKSDLKKSGAYAASPLNRDKDPDYESLFRYARKGDPVAKELRENSIRAWGTGIINLIHAYDPEKIVIGGGIMKSKDEILPGIEKMIEKHSWIPAGSLPVVAASRKETAGILGTNYLLNKARIKNEI
ncbi:ROK family protein [Sinomicrobium weinanense]|uniref:ROK family protein n=1 Tax=Sinomicrobium weinanense TaxID=2842200 RepID=A0A926JVF9_9FLAO|nr:ROK family protein [Sinomicrobium weinanense]MBC9797937.1 ROK family protein [Sinomicrobium weinanense]MBU3123271.1 ROK family protein [Sinomicrobium weinanense]